MMKKTFWAIMMVMVSGLALSSCSKNDSDDEKSEKTTIPYELVARDVTPTSIYKNVTEYHPNLYPLYSEYLALIDEVTRLYCHKSTVDVTAAGMSPEEVNEKADELTLEILRPQIDDAMALINRRMSEISAKLKSASPNEYEQLTAQLGHSIELCLVRRPGEGLQEAEVVKRTSDNVLEYNADAYDMKRYEMQAYWKGEGTYNSATAPNAFKAFWAAEKAVNADLDARLAAVTEGNCSMEEYLVMKTEDTPVSIMDDNAKKIFAKRSEAMKEWAAGAKELFMSVLDLSSVPQSELDQIDMTMIVYPVIWSPFTGQINVAPEFTIDVFKKK